MDRMLALLLTSALLGAASPAGAADGVVGTGTAGSCTESAFDAIFFAVQGSGGGTITFDCGAAPAAIVLTAAKPVSAGTEIDGGDLVTLSGGNATSLFQVYAEQTLTLRDVTLTRGYGTYGAVQSLGTLVVVGSRLVENIATASGGAVEGFGDVTVTSSVIEANSATEMGGGIWIDNGTLTVSNSRIDDNTAADGGGIAAAAGATVVIQGSEFDGNRNLAVFGQGGAIRSEGVLTVADGEFTHNGGSRGGALSVMGGTATVTDSRFVGNWASYGGAIRQEAGTLTVAEVQFTHNGYSPTDTKVTTGGGALSWGAGTATLTRVGLHDNWASYGGGFDHEDGATTLTNVTISANQAVGGGGFDQGGGSIDLVNVTIAGNAAPFFAGGIANRAGTLTVRNTLLSGNTDTDDGFPYNCHQAVANDTFSLSSDFTCNFGAGADAIALPLLPIAYNGGSTLSHLLPAGSPAIDDGTGIGCPPTDQRGVARPQGLACDVGAVEVPEPAARLLGIASAFALAAARRRGRIRTRGMPRRAERAAPSR